MDENFLDILDGLRSGKPFSKRDAEYLLEFGEHSEESDMLISEAGKYCLSRLERTGEICVQLGAVTGPCYADCGFCAFAYSTTSALPYFMTTEELEKYLYAFMEEGTFSAVSLMTIHDFDFGYLLELVDTAKSVLPSTVSIMVNTGDLNGTECGELKKAGVGWAYHALRLGESLDNGLEPLGRYETIRGLKNAGIKVATGIEPIGPEHTPCEIADTLASAIGMGCDCCSASAREPVPGTPLFSEGTVSERRLEQIRSAVILCTASMNVTPLGFYGGAYGGFGNVLCEYAGSPKSREELSEDKLGRTIKWAESELMKTGFTKVKCFDGSVREL